MPWSRRQFLQSASVLSGAFGMPVSQPARAQKILEPKWRTFELTTHIEILKPAGVTRVWAPSPLAQSNPFQRTVRNTVHCEAGKARLIPGARTQPALIAAEFPPGVKPVLTLISKVETRDWVADLFAHDKHGEPDRAELHEYLRPTRMAPTDGIVKQRATEITKGARTDVDKARAIYEWIVENTYRNPKTRGCGIGDIRFMLESGDLGGKCADLNALYVGLARAAGLPARDVYGIRIAPSNMGCKSLGVSSSNVTKAQHCRAEVFLAEHGWVPVDPADVRKVILEEPPGRHSLQDDLVRETRARLFGSWEMNWMAYNYAQDVVLPGASGPPLHFFMYPQAETAEGRLDSLDPDAFRYEITAREQAV
jgi:transglutaminase-like putative cysteine protease